jgi:serine-type D-Ala-D-Ala carboxypeptidase
VEFPQTRRIIAAAIAAGTSPAAVIEVGTAGDVLWNEPFGRLTCDAEARPASHDTIFDLASLTKVMATAPLAMQLVGGGQLRLDTPVARILDGWRSGGRTRITLRHLLDHSSGLPGHVRLWERAQGRAAYANAIRELPLEAEPGARSLYSDLGFMVLGFAIEAVSGTTLDAAFEQLAAAWGGRTQFSPAASLIDRIAPTEVDATTGAAIHGRVHDENAAALGGVGGHAGLFGPAADVGAFARLVLRTFTDATALGSPDLMRVFATATGVPGSSRALGWDTMRPTSSCGTRLSPSAIGHTGFTGTSLWIDWERNFYVVLLTNRIHPTRANESLLALRPRVHDSISMELEAAGLTAARSAEET